MVFEEIDIRLCWFGLGPKFFIRRLTHGGRRHVSGSDGVETKYLVRTASCNGIKWTAEVAKSREVFPLWTKLSFQFGHRTQDEGYTAFLSVSHFAEMFHPL